MHPLAHLKIEQVLPNLCCVKYFRKKKPLKRESHSELHCSQYDEIYTVNDRLENIIDSTEGLPYTGTDIVEDSTKIRDDKKQQSTS